MEQELDVAASNTQWGEYHVHSINYVRKWVLKTESMLITIQLCYQEYKQKLNVFHNIHLLDEKPALTTCDRTVVQAYAVKSRSQAPQNLQHFSYVTFHYVTYKEGNIGDVW